MLLSLWRAVCSDNGPRARQPRGSNYGLRVLEAEHDANNHAADDDHGPTLHSPLRENTRWLRRLAAALGLLGTLLAIAIPFLPVTHDIVTLQWPTAQGTAPVSAPLVSYQPLEMSATVPCPAVRNMAERPGGDGVLLDTTAPNADFGKLTGMSLQMHGGQLVVSNGGQQLAKQNLPAGDCTVVLRSDPSRTFVEMGGRSLVDQHSDVRPQVGGIFSDLDGHKDNVQGVNVQVRTDTRYQTTATTLKYLVIGLASLLFLASLVLLHKLDGKSGRRAPRLAPKGWWKLTWRDVVVFAVLTTWSLIGAITSDDGYILTIARERAESGYIGNYFRWFNAPEAPFGWFYELYAAWVQVSTATPWVRLPALLMGICSWLLISREVLPRLGQQVRRSGAAGWAAAAVFLSFWLPYNNGLRPEPVVAICALLGMCAVERAVATRRLLPAALGLFSSAFAVAATPTGLIAVLPFIAASRPLWHLMRERVRELGLLPVLAPLASAGTICLAAIYEDQTWKSVLEAKQVEAAIGPASQWYQELIRYESLFSPSADGSMARRFPVLLVILCLLICLVVLLRRGNIRGAALGPSRRLLGITMMSFVVLALTPTKWTHHFGAFSALGGSLAALGALATSTTVLRSRRNRAFFVAGLLIIVSLAATGPNAWWYVSTWGVPWFDKLPSINGHTLSTALMVPAVIALIVAAFEHLRTDGSGIPRPIRAESDSTTSNRLGRLPGLEGPARALRLGSAPLAIVCGLMVLVELASFVKSFNKEQNTYSLGKNSIEQLVGKNTCGLSDYIDVEAAPLQDVLPTAAQPTGADLQPVSKGFHRNGVPTSNTAVSTEADWTPPYGFGGDNAPIWGTFDPSGNNTGELRTPWYQLPADARAGKAPLVVPFAGQESGANSLFAEFGKNTPGGFKVLAKLPLDKDGAPFWREARMTLSGEAAKADSVRLTAKSDILGVDGWMAVGAPRVPKLTRMTQLIGSSPVYMEWPAALVYPCLRQPSLRNGVAEMPKYRIAAGGLRGVGQDWSAPTAGGPFGWLNISSTVREVPTFLRGSVDQDWGTLYLVDPYAPKALPASAAEQVRHETHWGTWSPGPTPTPVQIPATQQSDHQSKSTSADGP